MLNKKIIDMDAPFWFLTPETPLALKVITGIKIFRKLDMIINWWNIEYGAYYIYLCHFSLKIDTLSQSNPTVFEACQLRCSILGKRTGIETRPNKDTLSKRRGAWWALAYANMCMRKCCSYTNINNRCACVACQTFPEWCKAGVMRQRTRNKIAPAIP